jgi:hypothetical protein
MKLTSTRDAIKQAIEGGWKVFEPDDKHSSEWLHQRWNKFSEKTPLDTLVEWVEKNMPNYLTDPLFWQALGKARGWRTYDKTTYDKRMVNRGMMDEWNRHARDWFETRMSGGDEKKFWEQLP